MNELMDQANVRNSSQNGNTVFGTVPADNEERPPSFGGKNLR